MWHKTASQLQTDGSVVFTRWRQCALPCGHIGTTWRIWLNLCFLRPIWVHNPKANRSVQPFLHSSWQKVPILYNGNPFPQNCAFSWGISTPSNSWFLGPFWAENPNSVTISLAVFAQVTAECPYALQWAALSPKIAPFYGGSLTPSNTWFLGCIWAHNPNSISICSAIFAQMTAVSLYLTMERHFPASKLPLPMGDLDPHLMHGSLAYPSPQPKQHLDQFSRFCRAH